MSVAGVPAGWSIPPSAKILATGRFYSDSTDSRCPGVQFLVVYAISRGDMDRFSGHRSWDGNANETVIVQQYAPKPRGEYPHGYVCEEVSYINSVLRQWHALHEGARRYRALKEK